MLTVRFLKDGKVITKLFDSAYRCRLFIERAKRSKKIYLLTYPNIQ